MLRRLTEDDWAVWRALRLAALAEAPSAFGSTLADWSGAGDREERWRSRLTEVPYNVVAEVGGRAVGMVSCTGAVDGEAELISMWVDPSARGTGVGAMLIDGAATWARAQGVGRLVLSVRADNDAAIALYRRCGFVDVGPAGDGDPAVPERRMVKALAPGAAPGS